MLNKAQTLLFSLNIIHHDGSPNKNRLNAISGVHAPPLAEAIWVQSDREHATCEILLFLLRNYLEDGNDNSALSFLLLLYGMAGYRIPEDINVIAADTRTLHYFMQEFLLDLDDIFNELMAETA